MNPRKILNKIRERRKIRARKKIGKGTAQKPRLSVFRSHRYMYAQLIDDVLGKTLVSASYNEIKKKVKKQEVAKEVGRKLAEKAKQLGIRSAIFDRGKYQYHGRVQALAEGAREGGLHL